MRIADPAELSAAQPLDSVLTATMSHHVVSHLSNAMRDVDPFNAPGPAKMAVLKLDAGPMVAVVYHELKNLIEILAPIDHTTEEALAEVVNALRIPRASVEWVREGIALTRVYRDANGLPPGRFWHVTASPALGHRTLTPSESISLAVLVVQLRHVAGEIEPIDDTAIRRIELANTILFEDGSEAAPLAIYYTISEDGSTASIVDIEHLTSEKVLVAKGTLTSAIEAAPFAEPESR